MESEIIDLYNWHFVREIKVTKFDMINWVGSYHTHYIINGKNSASLEFHKDVCKGINTFEKYTDRVPYIKDITKDTFGCVLFAYQPLHILAAALNKTKEEVQANMIKAWDSGKEYNYHLLLKEQLEAEYNMSEIELETLLNILQMKNYQRLPSQQYCIDLAEEIVSNNFHFKPYKLN